MKILPRMLVLMLAFAMLTGCQSYLPTCDNAESVVNEAFLLSDLSQHAVDDTLFLVKFLLDDNIDDVTARDVEEYDSSWVGWRGNYAIIPQYAGSIIQVERMYFNEHLVLVAHDTPFVSISTDNYTLLIKNALWARLAFFRITVTYNGISVSYDMRVGGGGFLDFPYAAEGYVLCRTHITMDMMREEI